MGALARGRSFPAPLWRAAAAGGAVGPFAGGRNRRPPPASGATAVIVLFDRVARPFLHALDPEDAHRLAIRMLKLAPLPRAARGDRRLATRAFGLNFPNPIGVAAGFDKN